MKLFICSIILLLFANSTSFSQINKADWLIGGNGTFTNLTQKSDNSDVKSSQSILIISAKAGYFIFDRLAGGVNTGYIRSQSSSSGNQTSSGSWKYNLGPFVRYYFIKPNKVFNIMSEIGYQHAFSSLIFSRDSWSSNGTYSFSAGPVIYFNEHTAIEFTAGYTTVKFGNAKIHTLQSGIGLQIHLNK